MTGKTERVILVKGDHTKWYNQAIFIVNQNTPQEKMPMDFVAEAERIINNYMVKSKSNISLSGGNLATAPVSVATLPRPAQVAAKPIKKKGSKVDFVLNFLMLMACAAIVAVIVYGMLG